MTAGNETFTDEYLKFTHWFSQVQVREDEPGVRVPEKTIRCIWNDQLFKTKKLRTTDGEELEIVFPGYWNFGPGPDFKSATITVDGKIMEGDVELHVYSTDWKAHGHSANPEYGNVILHVFMWKGRGAAAESKKEKSKKPAYIPGAQIHELELKNYLTKGILELTEELDFESYPILNQFNCGLCHNPLSRLSEEKLIHLLNAAGDARIYRKMDRFHDRIIANGYEQTFYEGIAEALGYPSNKQPFQALADNLPLSVLRESIPPKSRKSEKVLTVQALLFGAAGLIDFTSMNASLLSADDEKYFRKIQKLWDKHRHRIPPSPLRKRIWQFGGIRPANYPYRRIAGLAHLIVGHLADGMFSDYVKVFQSLVKQWGNKGYTVKTASRHFDFFCVEAQDYWSRHYAPGGKELARPQQLIGPDRSREITINIVLPIALIYARASRSVEMESALNLLYQSGKGKTDNKLIRFMKHYIFGNKKEMLKILSSEKQVQGLMQVYQDFCTQNDNNCLRCQFPDVVNRYFA
ncbi:MAG: DUF2851 family protein [Nitrospinaceae bacterium]